MGVSDWTLAALSTPLPPGSSFANVPKLDSVQQSQAWVVVWTVAVWEILLVLPNPFNYLSRGPHTQSAPAVRYARTTAAASSKLSVR